MHISTHYDSERNLLLTRLNGDLDAQHAPEFITAVQEAFKKHPASIAFNCKELDFIDSIGLGALVKLLKYFEAEGFTLELKNLKPRIYKLFVITGLVESFRIEVDK